MVDFVVTHTLIQNLVKDPFEVPPLFQSRSMNGQLLMSKQETRCMLSALLVGR